MAFFNVNFKELNCYEKPPSRCGRGGAWNQRRNKEKRAFYTRSALKPSIPAFMGLEGILEVQSPENITI